MSRSSRRRRLALGLTLGTALLLGAASPAGAERYPDLLLDGGDRWFAHDVGYPVVLGPAEVHLGRRTVAGDLAANIHPDDNTMPGPGECESGIAFVYVDGDRGADLFISSAGDVCGHWVQEPNVVTHSFTGVMTIEESDRPNLEGTEGFLDITLHLDGGANVFATTW